MRSFLDWLYRMSGLISASFIAAICILVFAQVIFNIVDRSTTEKSAFQQLREDTPPGHDVKFIAISNYYHTPSLLGQKNALDYEKLASAGSEYCSTEWNEILKKYSDVPPEFLSGHCLMAAYIPALLSYGFRVEDDDGRVMLRLEGTEADVDWSVGALILLLH